MFLISRSWQHDILLDVGARKFSGGGPCLHCSIICPVLSLKSSRSCCEIDSGRVYRVISALLYRVISISAVPIQASCSLSSSRTLDMTISRLVWQVPIYAASLSVHTSLLGLTSSCSDLCTPRSPSWTGRSCERTGRDVHFHLCVLSL